MIGLFDKLANNCAFWKQPSHMLLGLLVYLTSTHTRSHLSIIRLFTEIEFSRHYSHHSPVPVAAV